MSIIKSLGWENSFEVRPNSYNYFFWLTGYSGDLKSGHVWISNGQSLSGFRMVRILNGSFSLHCLNKKNYTKRSRLNPQIEIWLHRDHLKSDLQKVRISNDSSVQMVGFQISIVNYILESCTIQKPKPFENRTFLTSITSGFWMVYHHFRTDLLSTIQKPNLFVQFPNGTISLDRFMQKNYLSPCERSM